MLFFILLVFSVEPFNPNIHLNKELLDEFYEIFDKHIDDNDTETTLTEILEAQNRSIRKTYKKLEKLRKKVFYKEIQEEKKNSLLYRAKNMFYRARRFVSSYWDL